MHMNLCEFKKVLLSVTDKVYHDEGFQEKGEYIVWTEVGENSLRADDSEAENAVRVNVLIFTDKEYSTLPKKLKKAFEKNDLAFEKFQSMYDSNLKFRQYSTFVEVD